MTALTVWNNCLSFVKDNIQLQAYKTWFEPIIPIKLQDNILSVQVPSEMKSLVEESYWCQLNQLPQQEWAEYFDGPTGTWVGQQSRTYQTWTIVGFLLMHHFLRNEYNDLDMFKI